MSSDARPAPPKAAPKPTPQTQPFWESCSNGQLSLQRCQSCDRHYFPPQDACPNCLAADVVWEPLSGKATLYSYVINHMPAPGFADDVPYVIAVVELAEGPRMFSNIIDIDPMPENLTVDMPLEVDFIERGDLMLPVFRPAEVR